MEKYLYLEKTTLKILVLGNILWISGLLLLLFLNVTFGPAFVLIWIALIIGGFVLLSKDGIELDLKNNQYRSVFSILGLNIGDWKNFPEIEYISISRSKVSTKVGGIGMSSTASARISEKVILINLFSENRKPVKLYYTKDENVALEICEKLKSKYKVEIINKL
ncbi:hypothetical protein [Flavobacterium channae]|uniref:hypothetical protein n=1 Tax=Flavobacterium channae TaxID=2897181 RepID=UPI001E484F52|nr:hypothetical protein [Flavobacterium channae]UGS23381.1 hypothetical protein LOS89_11550 [Flavobacterium channae]